MPASFDRCVKALKKQKVRNPFAICNAQKSKKKKKEGKKK